MRATKKTLPTCYGQQGRWSVRSSCLGRKPKSRDQFSSDDRDFLGCVDRKSDCVATDFNDCDADVTADMDGFEWSSGKSEHVESSVMVRVMPRARQTASSCRSPRRRFRLPASHSDSVERGMPAARAVCEIPAFLMCGASVWAILNADLPSGVFQPVGVVSGGVECRKVQSVDDEHLVPFCRRRAAVRTEFR